MRSTAGLFYHRAGSGPAVLTMHGGMGFDHTLFRPWLDPIAGDHTLVHYDHRGNGRSVRPADWAELSHASWADDAGELCSDLRLGSTVVLGHSYGSYLAIEMALRHPGRVRGLILVCATPAFDYPEVVLANARARTTAVEYDRVIELLSTPAANDAALLEGIREIFPLYFHRFDAKVARRLTSRMVASADAFNHANRVCLPSTDLTSRLGEISVPTLVVSGRHDWIMPPEHAGARVADGIPGARHVVMEGSGHFPFVEESEAFLELIGSWTAKLPFPAGVTG